MKSVNLVFLSVCLASFLLVSCQQGNVSQQEESPTNNPAPTAFKKKEYSVGSVLYVQTSAEYKALCFQAYNAARTTLTEIMRNRPKDAKPAAVVFDIDETLLDNSPYFAKLIFEDKEYTYDGWKDWTDKMLADTIPGGLSFTKFVKDQGAEVIYLSNRKTLEQQTTMKNMEKFGFPNVEDKFFFLKTDNSNKQPRRDSVLEQYDIVMLVGDNINDFNEAFEDQTVNKRDQLVKDFRMDFGKNFIVLPNPIYGSWKGAMYGGYDNEYTALERDSVRKSYLRAY